MEKDMMEAWSRYLAERADRPFGDVESVSGRALQPFSFAGQRAAANLLDKATRALDADNVDRATHLVERAARLPFDEHEQSAPAAIAAHMELFDVVTDAAEASHEDDSRWLDAAIEVLSSADDWAKGEIRDVLAAIDQDYGLPSRESARLREAVRPVPDLPALRDVHLTTADLAARVMSVLAACREYRRALAASATD